jgi:ParB family transcriptional regulator, chromosome partitioning protein
MTEEASRSEHRQRLGRGLAALLGNTKDDSAHAATLGIRKAPIDLLKPNPRNARKRFDEAQLDELTASIRERGVIQPILVRAIPRDADTYEIIAGERRWRAAQRAGKHEIPIIVVDVGEREALEIAIIENVQRTDLNALEEAAGYAQLGADYAYSHSDIARVVGKSRSHIANSLRLLNLPAHSQALLSAGQISSGHARALLSVTQPDEIADRIVAEHLTVRDVERLGENVGKRPRTKRTASYIDADTITLQNKLGIALGAKVTIRHTGDRGDIRIAFRNFEQLDDFCRRLSRPASG